MNMRLVRALNVLMEMKFVAQDTEIHIAVNKGKSIKKKDTLFECDIMVREAKQIFGKLGISLNQIRTLRGTEIPEFWFMLEYEE